MSWGDIASAVFNPGADQAEAADAAGNIQNNAAQASSQAVGNQFQNTSSQYTPYLNVGSQAAGILGQQTAAGTYNSTPFSYNPSDVSKDPAYQFALSQGIKGADMGAAARGGVLGGGQVKALNTLAQGTASQYENQDYGQANNTYNTNQAATQNQFGRYSTLAGLGQSSTAQLGSLGASAATTQADLNTSGAAAQAAGKVGAANAYGTAASGILGAAGKIGGAIKGLF